MQPVKRGFTLMEVLIALSLLGVVLGGLMYTYKQLTKEDKKTSEALDVMLRRHTACSRLQQIFSLLIQDESGASLVTKRENEKTLLHLSWDNKAQAQIAISGHVNGILSQKQDALVLTYLDKNAGPLFEEILLDQIKSFKVKFFDAKNFWQETWDKEFLPVMLMIEIEEKEKSYTWQFPLFFHDPHNISLPSKG